MMVAACHQLMQLLLGRTQRYVALSCNFRGQAKNPRTVGRGHLESGTVYIYGQVPHKFIITDGSRKTPQIPKYHKIN